VSQHGTSILVVVAAASRQRHCHGRHQTHSWGEAIF